MGAQSFQEEKEKNGVKRALLGAAKENPQPGRLRVGREVYWRLRCFRSITYVRK